MENCIMCNRYIRQMRRHILTQDLLDIRRGLVEQIVRDVEPPQEVAFDGTRVICHPCWHRLNKLPAPQAPVATAPTADSFVISGLSRVANTSRRCMIDSCNSLQLRQLRNTVKDGEQFDFIVVGAGSAGAIVANRLSEEFYLNVLLIEAGDDPNLYNVIPGLVGNLANTEVDWKYNTVNDSYSSQALTGGSVAYTRGKVLGGSSNMNFMCYVRGNPKDYDEWSNMGFKSWSYENVNPYFIKLEGFKSNNSKTDEIENLHYGKTGPVTITKPTRDKLEESKINNFLEAISELGIERINDYNDNNQFGATRFAFTHSNSPGIRSSTAEAYLNLATTRKNLYVLRNAVVSKVLIKNKEAYGVEVLIANKTINVYASQEVILSAGAFNTPKILMQSGIGPSDVLDSLGVDVLVDLPVGQNMQDHLFVPIVITGANTTSGIQTLTPLIAADYLPFPVSTVFFSIEPNSTVPDIQLLPMHFGSTSNTFYSTCKGLSFNSDVCYSMSNINLEREIYFTAVVILHPKSRGRVIVNSTDPLAAPIIHTGYFNDTRDLETMLKGIKKIRDITNSSYFKEIGSFIAEVNLPQCSIFSFGSDDYWKCYSLNMVTTVYHAAGTCAMGKVVDENLRVFGVNRLRVVDASVLPTLTSGNINAPVMMVAEKVSDIIKRDILGDINKM